MEGSLARAVEYCFFLTTPEISKSSNSPTYFWSKLLGFYLVSVRIGVELGRPFFYNI